MATSIARWRAAGGLSVRLRILRGADLVAQPTRDTGADYDYDADIAALYESEAPRLTRRVRHRVHPDKTADLVQSAFLRLVRLVRARGERVAEIDEPAAYLGRIADNLAKDEVKFAARRSERLHVDVASHEIATADPHAALEARDMLRRIEAAIPLLPERTREIFMAHRFEDLTYADIAERMGISVKTVEKHISLALRDLHRSLDQAT